VRAVEVEGQGETQQEIVAQAAMEARASWWSSPSLCKVIKESIVLN